MSIFTRPTHLALHAPWVMALLLAVMVAVGIQSVRTLPIDAFPDVSQPQVKVIVKVPGMTPEAMETLVTAPLEVEILGIPGQTLLRSVTKTGLSDLTIDFESDTDVYWARNQVAERLAAAWDNLPDGAEGGLAPLTTPLGETFMFTVDGPQSTQERRALLDWVIRPALRSVPGVADVNALGGAVSSIVVQPRLLDMAAAGLTLDELQTTLRVFNRKSGAGRLVDGAEVLLLNLDSSLASLDSVRNLVVRNDAQGPLLLRDVASVELQSVSRLGGVTSNGQGEVVEGLVLGLRGANARMLVDGIRARVEEIQQTLPEGTKITPFYDRGELVSLAVGTVSNALIEAAVLVLILLVIFLGSIRASLVVVCVLPLSALWTFMLMRYFGVSANLMSLGGLAIALGLLVDAAIVVVENILANSGEDGHDHASVHEATSQVVTPVVAGIAIIALVFVPLLTLTGLEGRLFAPVALTIVFALSGSLILSMTAIPLLARHVLKGGHDEMPWLPRQIERIYTPMLRGALAYPKRVVIGALVLLGLAVFSFGHLGRTFMPTLDEGSIVVQLEKLPSVSLEASLDIDNRFQAAVLERVPEVAFTVGRAGSDEIGLDPMGLNQTDIFMGLAPRDQWRGSKTDIEDAIREVLADFPGIAYAITQPIQMRVSEMIIGVRGDVAIRIFGQDLNELDRLASEIATQVETVAGSEDVYYTANDGVQYLAVNPDPEALTRHAVGGDEFANWLQVLGQGLDAGTVYRDGRRIPLQIRAQDSLRVADQLPNMPIASASGDVVTLGELGHFARTDGPIEIKREQGMRNAVVIANVRDRDLVGFVAEAQQKVADSVPLPSGYSLTWGGEFENQQRAAKRLGVVVPIALSLIFLILLGVFRSLRLSTAIMANIPFAMIGGVAALAITGEYLSVPASVGFIALLGIAVLNALVMVSHFRELQMTGMDIEDVVVRGALRRLRPVVLTASLAAMGLLPLLFSSGPGSEIQKPLAIVMIGGLISSTLLTLIMLPVLYRWLERGQADHP